MICMASWEHLGDSAPLERGLVREPVLEIAYLRSTRKALRAELSSLAHWRRLLRAKIDLTIARGTLPAAPGASIPHDVNHPQPIDTSALPPANDLAALCAVDGPAFLMTDLPALRAADASLAAHETAVRAELMRLTDLLVETLSAGDAPTQRAPWRPEVGHA